MYRVASVLCFIITRACVIVIILYEFILYTHRWVFFYHRLYMNGKLLCLCLCIRWTIT